MLGVWKGGTHLALLSGQALKIVKSVKVMCVAMEFGIVLVFAIENNKM